MFEDMIPARKKAELLEDIAQYGGGLSVREGSFTDTLMGSVAVEHCKVLQSMNALIPMFYVDESSGGYIDLAAARYGIARRAGTKASADITLVGKAGTLVPKQTVFLTAEGLEFTLKANVVLTGGEDAGKVEAVKVGATYNVEAGELTQMVLTISGLERWTSAAATGGTDEESDVSLVDRLYSYWRSPRTSGNRYDYRQWALEVPGVGAAKVFPLWNGAGTVKVLLVDSNKAPAGADTVAAVAASIEEKRPIGAAVTVESAQKLTIDVAYAARLDASTTVEAVKTAFKSKLEDYIKGLVFTSDTLLYNQVALLLLTTPGVLDYIELTVNSGTENLTISENQVPVLGEVAAS